VSLLTQTFAPGWYGAGFQPLGDVADLPTESLKLKPFDA
jgi:hypothetical protein